MKLLALLACLTALAAAADPDSASRGKYLAEEVAKCQDCHTARTPTGEPDKANWLKGATLDFAPTHEMKGWHKTAPDITGASRIFERWTGAGVVKFLETGLNPNGHKADAPMPFYTLKHEDAQAIVDYLKTLQ